MDLVGVWNLFCLVCGVTCAVSLAIYLLPLAYLQFVARPQDLRAKYGDGWCVLTGGSTGIGRALARKLASQGIPIVLVALDDAFLPEAVAELARDFPDVAVRPVPVDLSAEPEVYMKAVRDATDDVSVSMLMNNAGFLLMGFFHDRPVAAHVANAECNAMAAVRLTHHFYKRMADEHVKGCITFTSSAALFMVRFFFPVARRELLFNRPFFCTLNRLYLTRRSFNHPPHNTLRATRQPSPFALMYGATKSLLSHFATSLAVEAQAHGIDVTVFHPSYTNSNLYANTPKFGVLNLLARFAWTPAQVADTVFTAVGRVVVRDAGFYAVATNVLSRIVDAGALAAAITPFRDSMAPPGALKKNL